MFFLFALGFTTTRPRVRSVVLILSLMTLPFPLLVGVRGIVGKHGSERLLKSSVYPLTNQRLIKPCSYTVSIAKLLAKDTKFSSTQNIKC